MKKTDAAWLAGILDGEGSISLARGSRNRVSVYPQVQVSSTTPIILRRLVKITGVGRVKLSKQNGWGIRPLFSWVVVARQAAVILSAAVPYLVLKKKQALLAIRVARSIRGTDYGRSGLPLKYIARRNQWVERMKEYNKHGQT